MRVSVGTTLRALSWTLPCALILAASPLAAGSQGDDRSLEDLLEDVERQHQQRLGRVKEVVASIVAQLDALDADEDTATAQAHGAALGDLCPDALVALVPYLDPDHGPPGSGDEEERAVSSSGPRVRSLVVAEVLRSHPSRSVTDLLLARLADGNRRTKLRVMAVLETTPEPERVLPPLAALALGPERATEVLGRPANIVLPGATPMESRPPVPEGTGGDAQDEPEPEPDSIEAEIEAELQAAAMRCIVSLESPLVRPFFRKVLEGGDRGSVAPLLDALAAGDGGGRGAAVVRDFMETEPASGHARALAQYYAAHEELLQEREHAEAIVGLALRPALDGSDRVALFDLIRITDTDISPAQKRVLEQRFSSKKSPAISKLAAAMLLARNGDRGSRRDLLRPFDERLRDGNNLATIYQERARLNYDIGQWSDAVKDWREVLRRSQARRGRAVGNAPYVGLARALARLRKFRDAAETLDSSPLSLDQLRRLAEERDFREMVETRYRNAFHLEEK